MTKLYDTSHEGEDHDEYSEEDNDYDFGTHRKVFISLFQTNQYDISSISLSA